MTIGMHASKSISLANVKIYDRVLDEVHDFIPFIVPWFIIHECRAKFTPSTSPPFPMIAGCRTSLVVARRSDIYGGQSIVYILGGYIILARSNK
jgi:hypothetical protein